MGEKAAGPQGGAQPGGRAVARKAGRGRLVSADGRWTPLEEIDEKLALKVGKLITSVGAKDSGNSAKPEGFQGRNL